MLSPAHWQCIASQIEAHVNHSITIKDIQPVSGGCINVAFILQTEQARYFIKLNQANMLAMFEAEYAGLKEIDQTNTIKVPQPLLSGVAGDNAFLVLDMLPLSALTPQTDKQLGEQLARLHQLKYAQFGWHQDNTIGSTPQINTFSDNWVFFWQHYRLGFQLSLAAKNGGSAQLIDSGQRLNEGLAYFFSDYQPHASLLHGDLWGGNASATAQQAVIYDPACYYGDREADLAMTELFGGFSTHFYTAYNATFPLDAGYRVRKNLYNLYHILNHFNLFGSGYQGQAQQMIDGLLAEWS